MSANSGYFNYKRIGVTALRPIDFGLIVAGYFVASGIAALFSRWNIFRYPSPEEWSELPMSLVPLTLIAWSVVSSFGAIYTSHRDEGLSYLTANASRTIGIWAAVSLGAVFLAKFKYNSRQFMLEFILCSGILLLIRQVVTSLLLRKLREVGYDKKTALVVGTKSSCERFIAQANTLPQKGYNFVLFPIAYGGLLTEGQRQQLNSTLADEIFIVGSALSLDSADNPAIEFLRQGRPIHIVPEVIDATLFRQTLSEISGMPVLSISCGRLTWIEELAKRFFDIIGALLLGVVSAPIWILTAIIIKLTSPGPILFVQKRLGREGRAFELYKFRTMHCNAEAELMRSPEIYKRYINNNYKLSPDEDPRLTVVGKFLRTVSVDELPQLINVLRGEMSLVGPRPIVPAEIENYGEFASLFLSAKPGLTGHWQVSGRSEIREYRERVELDMEYIRDQSMRTDFEILLRTVPVVLRRKGAY